MIWEDLKDCEDIENKKDLKDNYMTNDFKMTINAVPSRKWLKHEKRYASDRHRGWFVGLAPADKPRIVVAVMIDEPKAGKYFGGDVAAPVFSQVVQQTLRAMGVPPDLDVKSQIVSHDIPAVQESF